MTSGIWSEPENSRWMWRSPAWSTWIPRGIMSPGGQPWTNWIICLTCWEKPRLMGTSRSKSSHVECTWHDQFILCCSISKNIFFGGVVYLGIIEVEKFHLLYTCTLMICRQLRYTFFKTIYWIYFFDNYINTCINASAFLL